ncbi:MAG: YvcK family protein [Clostridia bacterium]|nr:YvcK family protein [Clostridia bacterium]
MDKKKVVILGGGTGSSRILMSLKDLPIDITAVVTVSDNGRSTGRLRQEFSIPAVGDIRKVLSNLSTLPDEVKEVMESRLSTNNDSLNSHAIGNLILTSLFKSTNSLKVSIERLSTLLQVKHTVLPLSEDNLTLIGETIDGEIIEGEEQITTSNKKYKRIGYKEEPHVLPEVIEKIENADLVIISLGSLYTSILPHLTCKEIIKAINTTPAKVMYVCNAMTQPGETDGFGVSDHVNTLEKYIGKNTIDVVIASNTKIDEDMLRKYETKEQKDQVIIDYENLKDVHYEVIESDLLTTKEGKITHNSLKLSSVIFSYLNR